MRLFKPNVEEMEKRMDIDGLIRALKDSDARSNAAEALGRIGEPAVEPLIHVLNDEDDLVRTYAVKALGNTRHMRAVEPLIRTLMDKDGRVRVQAARALGKIGDKRAMEPLAQALRDKSEYVRWDAAEALDKLGWKPRNDTEKAHYLIAKLKWGELIILGEPAIEPLIQALNYETKTVREAAKEASEKIRANIAKIPMTQRLVHVIIYTEEPFDENKANIVACVAAAFPEQLQEFDPATGSFTLREKEFGYTRVRSIGWKDPKDGDYFRSWLQSVRKGIHDLHRDCETYRLIGTPYWGAIYFPKLLEHLNPEFTTSTMFIRKWNVIGGKILVIGVYSIVPQEAPEAPPTIPAQPPHEALKPPETPAAKKYCIYCGFEMRVEGVYCPKCGKRQIEEAELPPPEISRAGLLPKEPTVQILEVRTEIPQLGGRTASEEMANLAALAHEQERLLERLSPISEDAARKFFGKLGVTTPNEYKNAIQAFGSFRSCVLSSKGSAVHAWHLKINPSSVGPDALYAHLDDPVIPVGIAVCKLARGSFLGYYATRSEFKDKLGL